MKYTQIPSNTFEQIQLNAGVLLTDFDPTTGELSLEDIIGATSGGVNFTDTPSFTDYGDDIDNCPKNTKELKRVDSREVKMTGTYITVNSNLVRDLIATADVSEVKTGEGSSATKVADKITPRDDIIDDDFKDLWWVGDYSNEDGGFIAIHMMNTLSTAGFQIQSGDKSKGNFSFEYTAHYSIENQTQVPYEVYVA